MTTRKPILRADGTILRHHKVFALSKLEVTRLVEAIGRAGRDVFANPEYKEDSSLHRKLTDPRTLRIKVIIERKEGR